MKQQRIDKDAALMLEFLVQGLRRVHRAIEKTDHKERLEGEAAGIRTGIAYLTGFNGIVVPPDSRGVMDWLPSIDNVIAASLDRSAK